MPHCIPAPLLLTATGCRVCSARKSSGDKVPTVCAHEYSAAAAPSLSKSLAEEFNRPNVNRRQCGREALCSIYSDLQQLSCFTHSQLQRSTNERIPLPPVTRERRVCVSFPHLPGFSLHCQIYPPYSLYAGIIRFLYWVLRSHFPPSNSVSI